MILWSFSGFRVAFLCNMDHTNFSRRSATSRPKCQNRKFSFFVGSVSVHLRKLSSFVRLVFVFRIETSESRRPRAECGGSRKQITHILLHPHYYCYIHNSFLFCIHSCRRGERTEVSRNVIVPAGYVPNDPQNLQQNTTTSILVRQRTYTS